MSWLKRSLRNRTTSATRPVSASATTTAPRRLPEIRADIGDITGSAYYYYVERLDYRNELDPDGRGFEAMQVYQAQRDRPCLRASSSRIISPAGVHVNDGSIDRASGLVAIAGYAIPDVYVSESEFRMHPALWCGYLGGNRMWRIDVPGEPWSVDVAPGGHRIGFASWDSGSAVFGICEPVTGEELLLRQFEEHHFTGGEPVRFSPDGAELLIGSHGAEHGLLLMNAESGETKRIVVPDRGSANWWRSRTPTELLSWSWRDGITTLARLDPATEEMEALGRIELPPCDDIEPLRRNVWHIEVGPDGTSLLCASSLGPSQEHMSQHGSRDRIAMGRLFDAPSDGVAARIESLSSPFVDGYEAVEIQHGGFRWLNT